MARLGDVCEIVSGTTPKSNVPEYWDGEINWVTPAEIDDGTTIVYESQRKITEKAVKDSNLKSFPAGTVLLSSRAPIGKVAIAGVEMYCNQGFKNLICSEKIHNKYLFWFLKGKTDFLNSLGRGATFKEISKSIVEEIDIPLPTIERQKYYAATLDRVSDLISLRKQQLAKLDELVKARFVEMFGDPVSNHMKWPEKRFEEICTLITDGEHATPKRTDYGIYLLSARNVLNHALQLDDIDYINEEEFERIAKRIIPQKDDILISCSGSIGRCTRVHDNLKFQMVRSVALLRFDESVNTVFAEYLITSEYLQRQIQRSATQSSQANLFQGKIKKLHGYIPPIKMQQEFASFVEQTDRQKLTIQQSLDKLEVLKKSLMQEYFG